MQSLRNAYNQEIVCCSSLNSSGDNTLPCLTPLLVPKEPDIAEFLYASFDYNNYESRISGIKDTYALK